MPDDLAAGFDDDGFAGMFDTVVYQHFREHGGATPEMREAMAQRMHDYGIDNALADVTPAGSARTARPRIGLMGGHAVPRGAADLPRAAELAWRLARRRPAGRDRRRPRGDGGGQPGRVPRRPAAGRADRRDRPAAGGARLPDHDPFTGRRWTSAQRSATRAGEPADQRRRPGDWARARRPGDPDLAVRARAGQPVRRADREVLLQRHPRGHDPAAVPGRHRLRPGPGRHGPGGLPGRDEDVLRAPTAAAGRSCSSAASSGPSACRSRRCCGRCWPRPRSATCAT